MEQKRLDEARRQLEQQIAQLEMMPTTEGGTVPSASTNGAGAAAAGSRSAMALQYMQSVLTSTENQEAVGRVVVHFGPLDQLVQSSDNIELENGDNVTVPRRPVSVNVLGQVYSPNSIVYQPKLVVRDYLQMAGGPTQSADADNMYVIKADGSILTEQGVKDSERSTMFPLLPIISGGLKEAHLGPGDTIFVPEQLIYVDPTQRWKDITTIVANTAMSVAVLGILSSNL
jgi:protein involved in polysaccharide export with SLBB domain